MDIINPWGALRRAKIDADNGWYAVAKLKHSVQEQETKISGLEVYVKELELRDRLQTAHIEKLKKELAEGHFRNPKTGRLGHKGERF